jgi:DNA replication protein DnaC
VRRHRVDDSVAKAITRLLRVDLVIVDDIGLLPVSGDAAEAFYRLIDAAYEKRSLAISSNAHPAGFDELLPATLAAAGVSTGYSTTPTSSLRRVIPTGSEKPPPGRG